MLMYGLVFGAVAGVLITLYALLVPSFINKLHGMCKKGGTNETDR